MTMSKFTYEEIKTELRYVDELYTMGKLDELFGFLRSYDNFTQENIFTECAKYVIDLENPRYVYEGAFFEALVRFVKSCFVFTMDIGKSVLA